MACESFHETRAKVREDDLISAVTRPQLLERYSARARRADDSGHEELPWVRVAPSLRFRVGRRAHSSDRDRYQWADVVLTLGKASAIRRGDFRFIPAVVVQETVRKCQVMFDGQACTAPAPERPYLRRMIRHAGPRSDRVESLVGSRVAKVTNEPADPLFVCCEDLIYIAAVQIVPVVHRVLCDTGTETRVDSSRVGTFEEVEVVSRSQRWVVVKENPGGADSDSFRQSRKDCGQEDWRRLRLVFSNPISRIAQGVSTRSQRH